MKVFRTEAVRAEFKHSWQERDYRLIVRVAMRLPPSARHLDYDGARWMIDDRFLVSLTI